MICNKCGSEIPNGNRFCTQCGNSATPVETPAENGQKNPLLIVLIVLLGIAVLIGSIAVALGVYNCVQAERRQNVIVDVPASAGSDEPVVKPVEETEESVQCETEAALEYYETLGYDNIINYDCNFGASGLNTTAQYYNFSYPGIYNCFVPTHFNMHSENRTEQVYENYVFVAPDNTATIQLRCLKNTSGITAKEILDRKTASCIGTPGYSASGNGWYAYSVNYNGTVVYEKCLLTEDKTLIFIMGFPSAYLDVYDDYIEIIEDNFKSY